MQIASFDDLLQAARSQPEQQRLLFVFATAVLPEDATPEQRARFAAGQGGALEPLMYSDKLPGELASFDALVQESLQFGHEWQMVFAAALAGTAQRPPSSEDAEAPLLRMVEDIKRGAHGSSIPFNRQGEPVQLG